MKRVIAAVILVLLGSASAADPAEFTLQGGVKVRIVEELFDSSKHDIAYCESNVSCPCRVNGEWPYGTAPCQLPSSRLIQLAVTVSGESYSLDTSNMYNAWEGRDPIFKGHKYLTVNCQGTVCTVRGAFSDAAGTYVAEWQIQGGRSTRTLISAEKAIVFPFLEAMDKE